MTIGQRFKYYRNSCELSQDELCQLFARETNIKCSKSTISRIEKGLCEPSLKLTLAFIKILYNFKQKDDFKTGKISFFSFFANEIVELDKLEKVSIDNLAKTINEIKPDPTIIYEVPLFDNTFTIGKPFYKFLLEFEGSENFLNQFHEHVTLYKNLYLQKLECDYKKALGSGNYNKELYQKEIIEPMNEQIVLMRSSFNSFLKKFLEFYCDPSTKKPTE